MEGISMPPITKSSSIANFLSARKSPEEIGKMKRKLRDFYESQNEFIAQIEQAQHRLMSEHSEDHVVSSSSMTIRGVKYVIYASFIANVILLVFKALAAALSGSLVVLASTIDSALDIFSGAIMFVTHVAMRRKNKYEYPVGKNRYENLGIIVFAAVMGFSALQIVIESIRDIVNTLSATAPSSFDLSIWVISVFSGVILTKICLFFWAYRYKHCSSSCSALAQDHFNDICSNSVSFICLLIAHWTGAWYLDPCGAIALSIYIIIIWIKTGHHHLTLLVGRIADPKLTAKLTYYAAHFDPLIQQVDTVRAYHAGINVIVELDVIMPQDTPLKEAHDVGEALQFGLERFEEVERAFVHLDYEGRHAPEH